MSAKKNKKKRDDLNFTVSHVPHRIRFDAMPKKNGRPGRQISLKRPS